jgi:hypothetical protein
MFSFFSVWTVNKQFVFKQSTKALEHLNFVCHMEGKDIQKAFFSVEGQ